MMRVWGSFLPLLMVAGVFAEQQPAKPPHIVLIVADDLGYADVSFNPRHPSEVVTPNLDLLAKAGVVCRDGYVTAPVCSPTRAGLMTGRYQQRLGLYTAGQAGSGLPMSERIFPQYLAPAGYVCGQFGKWHLGPTPEWSPALRGFEEVFGFLGRGGHDYFKLDDPESPIYRGTKPVKESGYLTDRLGDEAAAFIERHKGRPFFVYLAFNAVHAPLQAPAEEIAKFDTGSEQRNTVLAMGKQMDDAVGRVVATLKKEALWDNTLLFFISDNGGPLALSADNAPLRGGKHQLFEGGVRVPFVVCWPSRLKPGESRAVVSSLDILPTVLAAAGIPASAGTPVDGGPARTSASSVEPQAGPTGAGSAGADGVAASDGRRFDGENILPVLLGERAPAPRNLFWNAGGEDGWWSVRSGDWKLSNLRGRASLFDLKADVSESNDLAKQHPERLAALTRLYEKWRADMADPISGGGRRRNAAGTDESRPRRPRAERRARQERRPAAATRETHD